MMDEATLAASGFGLASNLDDRGASPAFRSRSRWTEKIAFWIFRLATYFIIACTSYIFSISAGKAARPFSRPSRRSSMSLS